MNYESKYQFFKKQMIKYVMRFFQLMLITACTPGIVKSNNKMIQDSPNFKEGIFVNTTPTDLITSSSGQFFELWRWISTSNKLREPDRFLEFKSTVPKSLEPKELGIRAVWIGHSSLWIEIDGKRFLLDPVWQKRASPFKILGPKRFFDPVIKFEQLPSFDGVIISHNHYDHLDSDLIKKLQNTDTNFYVPLGIGSYLQEWGISKERIKEFDWWDEIVLDSGHVLAATPTRHFSGRGFADRNKSLWSSWVIKGKKHSIFFGGDGGYFPGFKSIGDKYGPFDLAFLEIAAYDENWRLVHMVPEEAIKALGDLKGEALFPIHWGTFNLAYHSWREPIERLLAAAKKEGTTVCAPTPGQLVDETNFATVSYWWNH